MNTNKLQLYRVQDDDGAVFVLAEGFEDALRRWRMRISEENPGEFEKLEDIQPQGVEFLAEPQDLLLPKEEADSFVDDAIKTGGVLYIAAKAAYVSLREAYGACAAQEAYYAVLASAGIQAHEAPLPAEKEGE